MNLIDICWKFWWKEVGGQPGQGVDFGIRELWLSGSGWWCVRPAHS